MRNRGKERKRGSKERKYVILIGGRDKVNKRRRGEKEQR